VDCAVDEALLRALTPTVIGILGRRGADFAAAEDAVQDALVEAVRVWPDDPPRDPKGWLLTVAWRKFLDATRADTSRRRREVLVDDEPPPGAVAVGDRATGRPPRGSVEELKQAAAAARDAQALLRQFPGVAGLSSDDAAWVEEECAEAISELLPDAISLGRSGKGVDCGRAIAAWFTSGLPCSAAAGRGGGQRSRRPTTGGRRAAGRAAGRALGARQGGPVGRARRGGRSAR
jgi:DNA-directed RNA polymerase specialized sigma24 family protein